MDLKKIVNKKMNDYSQKKRKEENNKYLWEQRYKMEDERILKNNEEAFQLTWIQIFEKKIKQII